MQKKTKVASALTITAFTGAIVVWRKAGTEVCERFPDYEPKLVRKTFNRFFRDSFLQRHPGIDDFTNDAEFDAYFIDLLEKAKNK